MLTVNLALSGTPMDHTIIPIQTGRLVSVLTLETALILTYDRLLQIITTATAMRATLHPREADGCRRTQELHVLLDNRSQAFQDRVFSYQSQNEFISLN